MKKIQILYFLMFVNITSALAQDSAAYDAGYSIGYYVGKFLPLIIIAAVIFLVYRFVIRKKRS